MGLPDVEVCRTAKDQSHINTVCLCACAGPLLELSKTGKLKSEASGEHVKHLHEHLKTFNFDLELSDSRKDPPVDSDDVKNDKWGKYTTRALRMFAKHPQVGSEPENVIEADGATLTESIANKICQWCSQGIVSPKNYWEFKQLNVSDGKVQMIDAYGEDLGKGHQSAWHHHIRQIQEDLSKTGFGPHKDNLCALGVDYKVDGVWWRAPVTTRTTHFHNEPANVRLDPHLRDLHYLTRKFQSQAAWLWRMNKDGTQLPDVSAGDTSYFSGTATGVMDQATAKALHAWAAADLHMVINKFALKELHWPPDGATAIIVDDGGAHSTLVAKLRSDAYEKWLAAATTVAEKKGTLQGRYSSSPRGWKGGKQTPGPGEKNANSPYSWHYSALAVDIGEEWLASGGSVDADHPYILEEDGVQFRVWCWADPQPNPPDDPATDVSDAVIKYRNRNIHEGRHLNDPHLIVKQMEPADPKPLGHMHPGGNPITTVKTGWYVDITAILENNGMKRINRRREWQTSPKAWEWWHYQFAPPRPPGISEDLNFGDYFQMIGVHELRLRDIGDGWPAHEDIEHAPG